MTPALDAARSAIEQQLEPIADKLTELEIEVASLRSEKAQLEAALKALDGTVHQSGRSKKSPKRPAAKKQDVIVACREVLASEHRLSADALEEMVGKRLKQQSGYTLSGFALRFKEALQSGQFFIDEDRMVSIEAEINERPNKVSRAVEETSNSK